MTFIKSEQWRGMVYMLNDRGEVWRASHGFDGQPIMERLGDISHDRMKALCEPQLAQLFPDILHR